MRDLHLPGGKRRLRRLMLLPILLSLAAAVILPTTRAGGTSAHAAATATGTYYFHGQAADQANKVNAPGTATFDQTAPTGGAPVTQQTTGVANQDFAGNFLAAYWNGPFSGTVDGG